MARRTLSSTWKSFERLFRQYSKGDDASAEKLRQMNELAAKVNASKIVDALATLFVHPYGLEEAALRFEVPTNGSLPEAVSRFEEEPQVLHVSAPHVFLFHEECRQASTLLKTPEARKSFHHYRYQAYLAELSKLPSQYLLFLVILRQVAHAKHISDVEKKGGEIEVAAGESYLEQVWAFKELEGFFRRTNAIDLRSEYGILWLESDWFVGK